MKRSFRVAILFIFSIFFITDLTAQESEIALDPVTITASLSPIATSKTGRSIEVIKGDQISKLPVHSIDELLRYVPGIEVQARGPMGTQSDIVIRGGTFQQVLVIIDGLRINDPVTGHFTSYIPIAPSEIDRIEILKGGASAIYGTEAVGGVIHIITKAFTAKGQQSKQEVSAQAGAGTYGLWTATAGGFFQKHNTAISVGLLSNNSDGQPQRGIEGYFNNNTVSASVHQVINTHWQVAFRTAYDSRKFAAQNFYTTFASDTAQEKVTAWWNQLQVSYAAANQRLTLHAGYKAGKDVYAYNSAAIPNTNNSQLWQALITHEWKLHQHLTLVNGTQFIDKKILSNDRGNHAVADAALFSVLHAQIGAHVDVSPALRLEWNQQYGWELIPQVNASWQKGNLQLRGTAGKTTRDADFTERYNNYNKPIVTSGRIGNPSLVAEHSFSYEAGADYFIQTQWKLSGTFFHRHHQQLIDWINTPYIDMPRKENLVATGTYALAKNIATINTTGVETAIQFHQQWNRNELWASLGNIWLQSHSSEAMPSFYITSHARLLTNFSVQFAAPYWAIGINGLYKSRPPQATASLPSKISNNYTIINVKGEWWFYLHRISLYAEADNVFNTRYSDLLGAVMPGRWLMGGFKISLSK